MSSHYLAYLRERYNEKDFQPLTLEQIADRFEDMQNALGNKILKKSEGFMTYRLEGDALIIDDFYVHPSFRGHTKAWEFHNEVISEAKKNSKRVAITFSEKQGKNQIKGIKAMRVSGFKPAYKTEDKIIFIKGI